MTFGDWIETVRLAWELLGGAAMVLAAILSWSMRSVLRQMVSKAELQQHVAAHDEAHDELDGRLSSGDVRFARIEEQLKHLPQRSDIDRLMASIADLSASLRKVEAEVRGVNSSVEGVRTTVNMLVKNELEG
jgi:hypothetical protein